MTPNQTFSLPRFFNLFRIEATSGYKMTLIVASVVFAFLIFLATIMAMDNDMKDFHQVWYSLVLLLGGFYFTSTSFDELNRKEQRLNYLVTPASIFEKFSLKLFLTTIGYLVIVSLLYWVFAKIADIIALNYFNSSFWAFNPFDDFYFFMIKLYLVLQSIFILGAVTFNRFSFFKTLFTLGVTGIIISAICFLLIRVVFYDFFEGLFVPREDVRTMPNQNFIRFMEHTMWPLIQNIFWFVIAPVLWVVAYFKLKEREV